MSSLLQDLRFGLRMLLKSPGFALIAIGTLALGIGANSAIFSVVHSVLLRPLPYEEPSELVQLYTQFNNTKFQRWWFSRPELIALERDASSFASFGAWASGSAPVSGGNEPVLASAAYATAGLLPTLGVEPAFGRFFDAEEDRPGGPPTVLVGHGLWQRVFGGDPKILGRVIQVDGSPREVVGVMPEGFEFPGNRNDLWVPLAIDTANPGSGGNHSLSVIARLKPGVGIESARAELATLVDRWGKNSAPNTHVLRTDQHTAEIYPLFDETVGSVKPALLLLLGAVGFVLLIACVNVANLLLARSEARMREIAVRSALGAGRARLVRQLLTESVLLGVLGGGFGVLLAVWGLDLLIALLPESMPRSGEIALDGRALGFTAAISIVTGLLFGLAPVVHLRLGGLAATLASGGSRTTAGSARRLFQNALVVVEFALAVVLVIGAGLMIKSFRKVLDVDLGFEPAQVLSMQIDLPEPQYPDTQVVAFWERLRERIAALPEVLSASAMSGLPPSRRINANDLEIEGYDPAPGVIMNVDYWQMVAGDYFATMGVSLVSGRLLEPRDVAGAPPVALVNEAFARRFFGDDDPIGRRVHPYDDAHPWVTIVGVVEDVKQQGIDAPTGTEIYFAQEQTPEIFGGVSRTMHVVAKTRGEPTSAAASVRAIVRELDPALAIADLRPLEEVVSASLASVRVLTVLLGVFSGLALLLAAVGIYGVMSYSVVRRTNEIGIRMALGARSGVVLASVLREGLVLAALGCAIGLGGAFVLTRSMQKLLFEVDPVDPAAFATSLALLGLVALLACFVPARRATEVDPLVALREA